MPLLETVTNTALVMPDNSTWSFPSLKSWERGTLDLPSGAAVELPNLESFTHSTLYVAAGESIAVPKLANIDNSRIWLSGGVQLSLPVTTYTATGITRNQSLFWVEGDGTKLELPQLRWIDDGWNDGTGTAYVHTIEALDGGQVRMPAVESIWAPARGEDTLEFITRGGGAIELTSLRRAGINAGKLRFDIEDARFELPQLESLQRTAFVLPENSTLSLPALRDWYAGSINVPTGGSYHLPKLTALTYGTIALGADQTLDVPNLSVIDNTRISLSGGSQLSLPVSRYSATGIPGNQTLFSVTGENSLLDLSSLRILDDNWNDGTGTAYIHVMQVTDGRIDLSNLETVSTPYRSEDRLHFVQRENGKIDLDNLLLVSSSGGQVRFDTDKTAWELPKVAELTNALFVLPDASTLDLPALRSWSGGTINVPSGGTLRLPELTSFTWGTINLGADQQLTSPLLSNIDNSRIALTDGAQLSLPVTHYSATGIYGDRTLFSVSGEQTRLDLSSLRSINDAWNDNNGNTRVHTITATGGSIDLSKLETITSPVRGEDRLDLVTQDGGEIDLDGLARVSSAGGRVRFDIKSTDLRLPHLASLDKTEFVLTAGSTLSMPELTYWANSTLNVPENGTLDLPKLDTFTYGQIDLGTDQVLNVPHLVNIDHSRIALTGGAQLTLPVTRYSATGIPGNQALFSVAGAGARLDLSSLRSINDAWNDGTGTAYVHTISADKGQILLSRLESIQSPARGEDRLDLVTTGGGQIDLDGLTRVTTAGGRVRFDFDTTVLELPELVALSNTDFDLPEAVKLDLPKLTAWSGSTINVPLNGTYNLPELRSFTYGSISFGADRTLTFPNIENINNSRIYVTDGAQLTVPIESYSATALSNNYTLFSVTGQDSLLDLSSLRSINDAWNDSHSYTRVHTLMATGGRIDLSGLETITSPVRGEDRLDLIANEDGEIDLSGLVHVSTAGGQVQIDFKAAQVELPKATALSSTYFVLAAGSELSLPALTSWSGSTIDVPENGTVDLPELATFSQGLLKLGADQTLNVPKLVNIDHSRIALTGGAQLTLPVTHYSATGIPGNQTLFSVSGAGTVLNLASLRSIDDAWDDYTSTVNAHTIAANEGQILLTGLESIQSPVRYEDRLVLVTTGGGEIDLSHLAHVTSAGGQVRFVWDTTYLVLPEAATLSNVRFELPDGGTLDLPKLTAWSGGTTNIPQGGTFNLPNLTAFTHGWIQLSQNQTLTSPKLANIDNTCIAVTDGVHLTLPITDYSAAELDDSYTLFSAVGDSAVLDLSSLKSISDDFDGYYDTHTIVARNGGQVNLSGLESITTPRYSYDQLQLIRDDGLLDLDNLRQIAGSNSGQIVFETPSGTWDLPKLESLVNASFVLPANEHLTLPALTNWQGGTLTAPDGGSVTLPELTAFTHGILQLTAANQTLTMPKLQSVDNTRIMLSGGAQLALPITSYAATDLSGNYTLISVNGGGSHLDLSRLKTIKDDFSAYYWYQYIHAIEATQGGKIDLSQVDVITGPQDSYNDYLDIRCSDGGEIVFDPDVTTTSNVRINCAASSSTSASVSGNDAGPTSDNETSPRGDAWGWSSPTSDFDDGDVFWMSDVSGAWDDAANWSTGRVPGPGDRVVINRPDVDVTVTYSSGASSILSLYSHEAMVIAGGSLTVNADSAIDGSLTINASAVLVASGAGVEFTATGEVAIDGAHLEALHGASIRMPQATTFGNGLLSIDGPGTFSAPNLASLDNTRFMLKGGAQFVSTVTSYDATGLGSTQTLFHVEGRDTLLDLSALETINDRWNDSNSNTRVHTIQATNGGHIDLSRLQSMTAPARGEDRLDIRAGNGGTIDLDSLERTFSNSGQVWFVFDTPSVALPALIATNGTSMWWSPNGSLDLPVLESWDRGSLTLPATGSFSAPQLASFTSSTLTVQDAQTLDFHLLTNIDDSRFVLSGGAHLTVAAASYSAAGLASSQTLFSVEGVGTRLDLSSLEQLIDNWNDSNSNTRVHTIRVVNGGQIDLSGLDTIEAPIRGEDRLDLVALTGGQIELDALRSTVSNSGQIRIDLDLNTWEFPLLESLDNTTLVIGNNDVVSLPQVRSWHRSTVTVPTAATVDAPNLTSLTHSLLAVDGGGVDVPQLTDIDNSRVLVSGGSQVTIPATHYTAAGITKNQLLFAVEGAASVLDLSTLQTLDDAWNDGTSTAYVHTVRAIEGGLLDLSGLRSVVSPARSEDRIDFYTRHTGDIKFDSLQRTSGGGTTQFDIDSFSWELPALESAANTTFLTPAGASLKLPALSTWSGGSLSVPAGGTYEAPGLRSFNHSTLTLNGGQLLAANLEDIDNSRFVLRDGAQLSIEATSYTTTGIPRDQTLFSVEGAGTQLDLSSLQRITDAWNDGTLTAYSHTIRALNGGVIDLSGLKIITSPARSEDRLDMLTRRGGASNWTPFRSCREQDNFASTWMRSRGDCRS